jgi:hypothetical protein
MDGDVDQRKRLESKDNSLGQHGDTEFDATRRRTRVQSKYAYQSMTDTIKSESLHFASFYKWLIVNFAQLFTRQSCRRLGICPKILVSTHRSLGGGNTPDHGRTIKFIS